ncbi:hypothetical protein EG329_007024 [Mollisiaceae sp. DMI_Dod_QoI]|nr:hypothetical protein EG329_007024 [Helotiales sp. DMI_Dod_QoI]
MRQLPREVVAAIDTAVEVNDGVLESAYIHSLAKIYKTSQQAVVWNMKRYNKVKAGCDDRKKSGRPAAMDKDKAAEYLRELMAETHRAGGRIKMDEIAEKVSQEFGVHVSPTWTSRLMKKCEIPHKEPKPPRVKKVRIPKPPKPPKPSKTRDPPGQPSWVPQYNLPSAGQYPSFREDLQQAMTTAPPPRQFVDIGLRREPALPPAARSSRPPPHPPNPAHVDIPPDFEGFGMLKLSKAAPPPPTLPPMSAHHSFPPQYQFSSSTYPRFASTTPTSSSSHSPSPSENSNPTANNARSSAASKSANADWEVLKVVELP